MNHRILSTLLASLIIATLSLNAATSSEMEQARAIAIKWCLRGMNSGSGYLDGQKPKNIADLENVLKAKEKDNIVKLKSISLPPESEYASWGKAEFDKYWKNTFFGSGTGDFPDKNFCRSKAMAEIGNISVTAQSAPAAEVKPETTPEEKADEQPAQQPEESATDPNEMPVADPTAGDVADTATAEEANIEQAVSENNGGSGNTVSVVILVILVIVVVALVVYALNVMNRNRGREDEKKSSSRQPSKRKESASEEVMVDDKDREIMRLSAEVGRLRKELQEARADRERTQYAPKTTSHRPTKSIYLAQADDAGTFLRADARFNMGNSIFRLDTSDGVAGSFTVIDDSAVHELALMIPDDFLANACEGASLRSARPGDTIVNERPGTAIFEDGRWRVSRKALIRIIR